MSKNNVVKIVCAAILSVLIVAVIVIYFIDVFVNGAPYTENLFRLMAFICLFIGSMIRIFYKGGPARKSLEYYEKQYDEILKDAFAASPIYKKKLLCAIRLYNENNFRKAMKYLVELKPVCKGNKDVYAVGLFIALILTDTGLPGEAIKVYDQLIDMGITSATIYGNLGSIYSGLGSFDDAIANIHLAIQNDDKKPEPYNNLAKLYFDNFDFEKAKEYAKKALELNHRFRQPATLLAVIYSKEGDAENAEKYKHIALSCGLSPEQLERVIQHYKTVEPPKEEEYDNDDEADTDGEDI